MKCLPTPLRASTPSMNSSVFNPLCGNRVGADARSTPNGECSDSENFVKIVEMYLLRDSIFIQFARFPDRLRPLMNTRSVSNQPHYGLTVFATFPLLCLLGSRFTSIGAINPGNVSNIAGQDNSQSPEQQLAW